MAEHNRVHGIHLEPPQHDAVDITKNCEMPVPQSICITFLDGERYSILRPSILGEGQARNVLSGNHPVTGELEKNA